MLDRLCSGVLPGVSCIWDLLKDSDCTSLASALHQAQEFMDLVDLNITKATALSPSSQREKSHGGFRED